MALSIAAQAEVESRWAQLSVQLQRALRGCDARWLDPIAYPNAAHPEAWIEIGPADPIRVAMPEGLLLLQARTAPWGPGYHQRVTEVVDALGRALPRGWDRVEDPTGYWDDRRAGDLARIFLRYAHALWSLNDLPQPLALLDGVNVGLVLGEGPAEVPVGKVATPTGFKTTSWIQRTRDALRTALTTHALVPPPAAREAFLWWFAEPDAFDWVQLGRAICTTDVIWRPLPGEDSAPQVEVRERAVACFEAAFKLDPSAAVPLAELRRLYELLGRAPDAARLAEREVQPFQGGYREGWIRCALGSRWTLQVPGWLRATCDAADGHDVFWDDRMTVHVTLGEASRHFSPNQEAAGLLERLTPEERAAARVELFENGSVRGYVLLRPYEGNPNVTLVQGQVGRESDRVTFTVLARTPEVCPLALRLGRSLTPA